MVLLLLMYFVDDEKGRSRDPCVVVRFRWLGFQLIGGGTTGYYRWFCLNLK
ncbi:hypothetical protein AXX17_AT3G36550 [Arabidopsis thaliana]|uniref:Uncharacterized protein n=1 Tax=Arabidopsis thaliana TaxID=3702 RepID=A0A178VDG8_ARATH|nr:hypothetical protein AXX17_AT3G36550 [Arabidopsis thaliana]